MPQALASQHPARRCVHCVASESRCRWLRSWGTVYIGWISICNYRKLYVKVSICWITYEYLCILQHTKYLLWLSYVWKMIYNTIIIHYNTVYFAKAALTHDSWTRYRADLKLSSPSFILFRLWIQFPVSSYHSYHSMKANSLVAPWKDFILVGSRLNS